ncbi:portal protein [Stenotrophomonas phage Philippe]|uniref:Portal protein n=1 Tax=Stenotrophomonas phage Philippe TaxID=2859655 RepID=A0AAE7WN47_9CAUD|nr:portal protein [Stenotrophomonas phage Philippe]QYW02279.1 portal protein [Stenotrophomonas phage Philippe]
MTDQNEVKTLETPTSHKMTSWAKEPSIQDLKRDHQSAQTAHNVQVSKIRGWRDLMNCTGKEAIPKVKGRSNVQPKLVRRQAEWRYSALTEPFLGSYKTFKVTAKTFEDVPAARQNELLLNWQFQSKMNRVQFIDDVVRSQVDEGTVIVQTGWDRQTIKVKEQAPVWSYFAIESQEEFEAFQQALQLRDQNRRGFDENAQDSLREALKYYDETGEPVVAIQMGTTEVEVEKILVNRPTATVLDPENVVIDPTCNGNADKALFFIVSFETNKAELLKVEGRYKNLDKVIWDNNSPATHPEHQTSTPETFQFQDVSRKKVVAHEYWGFYDIDGNGTLKPFVATWIGDVLIRLEESPFDDGKLPFVVIPYLPVKRSLYGEPDAELLGDNQRILGALTRGMVDLLGRSANGQRGIAKGMLDVQNKRRFDNGDDYEFNPSQNPLNNYIEHKYPELSQSALVLSQMQNQEAESLTGVKDFAGGISGEAFGDVAAGIRGVLDAASKREMAILRRLARGITEIGIRFIAMNNQFLSKEEVIRVTNEEFVTIRREELRGEFDLEVDISTAEVDNAKSQDIAFLVQTIGPNTDQQITLQLMAEIARLKRMPDLAKKLETFQPQPSPQEQQMQQLALEKAQLENDELRAKVELAKAQAQKALADAQATGVDTAKEVDGTKFAEGMAHAQAQSQGNQEMAVTKALTTPVKEGEKAPDLETAIGFNRLSALNAGQAPVITSTLARDGLRGINPAMNLRSPNFNPAQDPSLNLGINI